MKTSKCGIEFIISHEGFCRKACKCVATEKYYTIGYGHYGADVKSDMTITKESAIKLLKKDLAKFEEKVNKYSGYNWTQNEFDALVSFAYNVGNIDTLTRRGTRSKKEISDSFERYVKSGGKVLNGLVKRRKDEKELFDGGTVSYYPKYMGNSSNIDIIFKSIGVPDKYIGSWDCRKPIAAKNGILKYTGSIYDNIYLIELCKKGKLKR